MVADNYCFAVDGDRIQMNDIFSDDQVSFLFNKQMKANFYMLLLNPSVIWNPVGSTIDRHDLDPTHPL